MFKTQKQRITETINRIISDSPYTQDFRDKVIRSLMGEYTQEEIEEEERRQQELLARLEFEFDFKHCIQPDEAKVFVGMTAQEIMARNNIEGQDEPNDKTSSSGYDIPATD